jgi:transcriptional regulator with XRE-family HTH domain
LTAPSIILDTFSIMMETDIHSRIASRVGSLRTTQGLSLDALAARSGVSRSMISLIERAQSSPTAAVLEKLAAGLGVSLASLFEAPGEAPKPLNRRDAQTVWRDPESGYLRRNVSPVGQPLQIVEVEFPAHARVALEGGFREPALHQQIWVLEGTIELHRGAQVERLEAGDCLAMEMGGPIVFRNPTPAPARYAVVIAAEPMGSARR